MELLKCSEKVLRDYVRRGELSYILKGGGLKRPRRLFHPDDLAAFIAARRRKTESRDTYVIDFQCGGRRFCISTSATNRRAAEQLETAERERANQQIAAERAAAAAFRGEAPLTLKAAGERYWTEAGQHHAGSDTTWTDLCRAMGFFGAE
eukprot:gene13797-17484_t